MTFADAQPDSTALVTLGGLFLMGLGADAVGRRTPLPRVTLLLLGGIAVGPIGLSLVGPDFVRDWFPLLTHVALGMVGFLLGGKVTVPMLRLHGTEVVLITAGKVFGAFALVTIALRAIGVDLHVALLLGAVAPATDPAATFDVVRETDAEGDFVDKLLAVVAIDDALGLLLFSIVMALVSPIAGEGGVGLSTALVEIFGSAALGLALGAPVALIAGRVRAGEPSLIEALGVVFLCSGLALRLGVSPILASMAMGATVASLTRHYRRPFHAVEGIEWPFLITFFVLAGASMELDQLATIGLIGTVYLVGRTAGTWLGCYGGCAIAGSDRATRRFLGLALLPQAGVAIGIGLIASQRFPDDGDLILSTVLATTVIFELVAPIVTRRVLRAVA